MRAPAMEDSLSFLTPTGELPLIPLHPISIKRPVQLWLVQISPLFVSFAFTFLFRTTACYYKPAVGSMLTGVKAISELVAAIAILHQTAPVSLPVTRLLPDNLLLVFV